MSARITIQSGIAAGTSHRIAGRVARVGSDPKSDICLPTNDIPEHALTLEFRNDGCLVYNRCRDRIYIGSQVVEPEKVVEWPETDILQLGQDIELLLDFDDAEPDAAFADYDVDDDDDSLTASTESSIESELVASPNGSGTKTALQLGVIVVCLIGCALLLLRDQNRKTVKEVGPKFADVISASLAEPDLSPNLIRRIQYAEAQRIRGREKVARKEFESIRDDLIARDNQVSSDPDNPKATVLRLIQDRLGNE